MKTPEVSVLLPVYNGGADLKRALASVLEQSFTDFEVIAINDGSKDESASILDAVTDPRVKVIHQDNVGLAATLNKALGLAQGTLIARQDQDDFSHRDRFAKQVEYMRAHPDCVLLGTAADIWAGDTPTDRGHDHPQDHALLAFDLLFNNPFVHSSVFMRRDPVLSIGGYSTDRSRQPPEDYELWSRLARIGRVANLKERLLIYREVPQSMSRTGPNPFLDRLVTISAENLALASGRELADQAALDAAALTHSAFHRLSKKPDIRAMLRVLEDAGARLAGDNPEVKPRAAERMRILQYQWMMYRTNASWAHPFLRRVKHFVRRLPLVSRLTG